MEFRSCRCVVKQIGLKAVRSDGQWGGQRDVWGCHSQICPPPPPLRAQVGGSSDCRYPLKRTNTRQMTSVWLGLASPLLRNSDKADFSETEHHDAVGTTAIHIQEVWDSSGGKEVNTEAREYLLTADTRQRLVKSQHTEKP
jgi:hypothetical protein